LFCPNVAMNGLVALTSIPEVLGLTCVGAAYPDSFVVFFSPLSEMFLTVPKNRLWMFSS
jgi:hypothetical protein